MSRPKKNALINETMSMDPFHWAHTFIDAEHRLVHEGLVYSVSSVQTGIANGASASFLMKVPAGVFPHARVIDWSASNGAGTIFLYEDTAVSGDGTTVDIRNRNRVSSRTASSTLFVGPTVTNVGTELDRVFLPDVGGGGFFAGPAGIFGSQPGEEWVFKPNSNYMFRLTNNSGAAITIGFNLAWYELDGYGRDI